MDPFSSSTGIVGLVAIALKLVVGALGMIDKTVAANDEAADELKSLACSRVSSNFKPG